MLGASINNNLKMKRYMKKILFYFLIMICLSTITGCSNYSEMEIPYKDDHINEPSTNYTYRFVGQSEHFYFQTGKVYYDGKYRALLISNLKVKDNVKSNATFSINLYFNDKSLFVADRNLTKNAFEDTIIAESGELGERDISGNVTINRAIGRSTWYFVDEFHLLLKEEQTAAYSAEIWKRFRKWGGIPTGATQNPKDLLSSPEIENILENSDFIYMLNQAAGDRKILAERLNISSEQLAYVTNSEPGHGLLFFNNVILPFADDFPKDTELYKLLTTKPSEVAHETVDDEKEDQNG